MKVHIELQKKKTEICNDFRNAEREFVVGWKERGSLTFSGSRPLLEEVLGTASGFVRFWGLTEFSFVSSESKTRFVRLFVFLLVPNPIKSSNEAARECDKFSETDERLLFLVMDNNDKHKPSRFCLRCETLPFKAKTS